MYIRLEKPAGLQYIPISRIGVQVTNSINTLFQIKKKKKLNKNRIKKKKEEYFHIVFEFFNTFAKNSQNDTFQFFKA